MLSDGQFARVGVLQHVQSMLQSSGPRGLLQSREISEKDVAD